MATMMIMIAIISYYIMGGECECHESGGEEFAHWCDDWWDDGLFGCRTALNHSID